MINQNRLLHEVHHVWPKVIERDNDLDNSWARYSSSWYPFGYYKDHFGNVWLRGLLKSGTDEIDYVGEEYRPHNRYLFAQLMSANALARVDVDSDGLVDPVVGSSTYTNFSGTVYDVNLTNWTAVSYQNSWVDYGTSFHGGQYKKDAWGRVFIRGLVKNGTVGQIAFTLPSGYRPDYQLIYPSYTSGSSFGRIEIQTDGDVYLGLGSNTYFTVSIPPFFTDITYGDWSLVGEGDNPDFENSWDNFGSVYAHARYYRDPSGRVYLSGLVNDGTVGTGTPVFTLPTGYRPKYQEMFIVISNAAIGRVDVKADGSVSVVSGNNTYVSLDGISFLADNTL